MMTLPKLIKATLAFSAVLPEQLLAQGYTCELLVSIKGVRKARNYDLQYGPVGAGGATPTAWLTQTVPNAKTASISGLTPGTAYAIQVRAYGPLGHTEWSDSATRMCI